MNNYERNYIGKYNISANKGGNIFTHIKIAEEALGRRLEYKNVVHHVDEDKTNNCNFNLVICEDEKYHRLLHARQRVLKGGGDPNTQKFCTTCKNLKNKLDFYRQASKFDHLQGSCIKCKQYYHRVAK